MIIRESFRDGDLSHGGFIMAALLAALVAIYLGAFGPRFRWTGGALLASVAIVIGMTATIGAAISAHAAGYAFAITPASFARALAMQAAFMLGFYGLATLGHWSFVRLTAHPDMPRIHERDSA